MKLIGIILTGISLFVIGCATPTRTAKGSYSSVEEKYAHMLGVDKEDISNHKLYAFVDDWYGVPYKYAGKTKKGVDCSGFTSVLYQEIYNKSIAGSSASLYTLCKRVSKDSLREGDLVFFKIDSKEISHVGVYLQNGKFVHATSKGNGVKVNDLDEEYYKKYYFAAGRIQ